MDQGAPGSERAGLREEYGWEYRLVSDTCRILQFAAAMTRGCCRLFQLAATRRSRHGKIFNPKVVGSIPTRPIGEKTAIEPNQASTQLLIANARRSRHD